MEDEINYFNNYISLNEQIRYLKWSLLWTKGEYHRWKSNEISIVGIDRDNQIRKLDKEIIRIETQLEILIKRKLDMLNMMNIFEGVNRQIVQLKYIEGMTTTEISEITSYSISYIQKKHVEIKNILKYVMKYQSQLST
ncbi:hypothetical protein [Vagococcus fluvialis]